MGRKKKVEEPVEEEQELQNGEETNPEGLFDSATVTVNMKVAEILGRPVENEKEQQLFLALISSFFTSPIIQEQLTMFVRFNMQNEPPKAPEIIVPEKPKLILPG